MILKVIAAGGAAALLLAGCSTTTQSAKVASTDGPSGSASASTGAKKNAGAVGQTFEITGTGGLKATVQVTKVEAHTTGTGVLARPPAHGAYIVANVHITVTAGTYNFNPLYFKAIAADGNSYSPFDGNAITAGFDPSLSSGALGAGQSTGGNVTFDTPNPAHGTIQVADPLGSVVASWTY